MKIAIISDSHDNITNIYKFLDYAKKQKVEMIIHCGDISAASVMREMAEKFSGKLHFILGNVASDIETLKRKSADLNNVTIYYEETGKLEIDGEKIAFTHPPYVAKELAESKKYDYVFYGHSHKPWIEKVDNTYLINPGTLAGLFAKATFALWDTSRKEPKLIILERI